MQRLARMAKRYARSTMRTATEPAFRRPEKTRATKNVPMPIVLPPQWSGDRKMRPASALKLWHGLGVEVLFRMGRPF